MAQHICGFTKRRARLSSGKQCNLWDPTHLVRSFGQRILFLSGVPNGGFTVIRSKNADGSGEEEVLEGTPRPYFYPAWTPDGKSIAYVKTDGEQPRSFWRQSLAPTSQPEITLRPPS